MLCPHVTGPACFHCIFVPLPCFPPVTAFERVLGLDENDLSETSCYCSFVEFGSKSDLSLVDGIRIFFRMKGVTTSLL